MRRDFKVKLDNPPVGFGAFMMWMFIILIIMNSCDSSCKGASLFECAGIQYKEIETDFKKGYNK